MNQDFSEELSENWREFNRIFIPICQQHFSEKSKIAVGLACGASWTISKGI